MAKRKHIKKESIRENTQVVDGLQWYMKKKLLVLFYGIIVALVALSSYLTYFFYKNGDEYSKYALNNQSYASKTLPFRRGDIRDTNGTVLAYSTKVYNMILDPKIINDGEDRRYTESTINALVSFWGVSRSEIETILVTKSQSSYVKYMRSLTSKQVEDFNTFVSSLEDGNLVKGVWFEDEYVRSYPFGSLACDVIGFASSASVGSTGLESYYNDVLSGVDGVSYGYVNSDLNLEKTTREPVDGYNIITSIDYSVQSIIEKHIAKFNEEYGSNNTAVIVMNPNNGEIIAEASYPVFDLNKPRDLSGIYTAEELALMDDEQMGQALYKLWKNYCVSDLYEPGSTIKPFTIAAGLEEGYLFGGETYECDGVEQVLDKVIKCHNVNGHGTLTLEESIMQSCNDALMQIGAKLGSSIMSKYQDVFGFGYKTYVDLPNEDAGLTVEGDKMDATDIATNSFGQNLSVNMHQMIAGFASLINGGYYYQPHFVKRIETINGEVVKTINSNLIRQTVTSETCDYLKEAMRKTVTDGTASRVKIDGYDIGGKTGTAEVWAYDEEGKNLGYRSAYDYVISFMGFAPVDDPQFVIYVLIDSPKVEAGLIGKSAPVCTLSHDILVDILPYLHVYPEYGNTGSTPQSQPTTQPVTQPQTETITQPVTEQTVQS